MQNISSFHLLAKAILCTTSMQNISSFHLLAENPALSRITSYGFLAPYKNSEKTNDTIPRKRLDRRTDGKTEGRTDPIL